MKLGRVLLLLLLACLVSNTPLAYASPPDPTWMAGIYDDNDGDDVIGSITWAAWAVELDPLSCLTPRFVAVPFAPPGKSRLLSLAARPAVLGRAPPLA
jgi:hypothetical protein